MPQSTDPTQPNYVNPAVTAAVSPSATPAGMMTAPAGTATASQVNPITAGVNTKTDTVQGQLADIIDQNSPLMQQANRRALQQANARGMLNSTQAINAAQSAVIAAATPIAQQDASTFSQARLANQTAENQAAQTNAQLGTDVSKTNSVAANALQSQAIDNSFKAAIANADAQNKVVLQELSGNVQTRLAGIQADYQTLMQTSSSASDMFKQTQAAISQVVTDTNMDATAKAAAINGYLGWMQQGMNLIGSINGIDLGQLLNFGRVTAA